MADDVERAASDVLKAMGACAAKDHRACQDKQQKMRTLIAAAEARGREQAEAEALSALDKERSKRSYQANRAEGLREAVFRLLDESDRHIAERDAALLLAGESLNALNELAVGAFSGMWGVGSGELEVVIGEEIEHLFTRPDAQAALAKWREQRG